MKKTLSIVSVLLMGLLSGCRTSSPKEGTNLQPLVETLYSSALAPFQDMFVLKHGSLDLLYDTTSFRNRNGRWPEDYPELTNFVNSSGGYLWIGSYKTVEFRSLTNDYLEIAFVRLGQTNKTKITIGDVLRVK